MSRAASSPQMLRRTNLQSVLAALRAQEAATVTDLMAETGLTRATVFAVCEDLIRLGWVHELENSRLSGEDYVKGRPARRFSFSPRAGAVVGVDLGLLKVTAMVADLRGVPLARVTQPIPAADAVDPAGRLAAVDGAIHAALARAGIVPAQVLAVTVGVPAPVSRSGEQLATDDFWKVVRIDAQAGLGARHGWRVQLENDANLAVLAERWQGAAQSVDDAIALLSGERLGAGITESGRLLHGNRGGFGEMGFLNYVRGVGDTRGMASTCRDWGAEAVAAGADTLLAQLCGSDPDALTAEMVFRAAAESDAVARKILRRVTSRMARVIATLGSLTNPELVVICGAVAPAAATLLDELTRELDRSCPTPPRVVTSALGDQVVTLGAVRHALNYVDDNAIDLVLSPVPPPP